MKYKSVEFRKRLVSERESIALMTEHDSNECESVLRWDGEAQCRQMLSNSGSIVSSVMRIAWSSRDGLFREESDDIESQSSRSATGSHSSSSSDDILSSDVLFLFRGREFDSVVFFRVPR